MAVLRLPELPELEPFVHMQSKKDRQVSISIPRYLKASTCSTPRPRTCGDSNGSGFFLEGPQQSSIVCEMLSSSDLSANVWTRVWTWLVGMGVSDLSVSSASLNSVNPSLLLDTQKWAHTVYMCEGEWKDFKETRWTVTTVVSITVFQ